MKEEVKWNRNLYPMLSMESSQGCTLPHYSVPTRRERGSCSKPEWGSSFVQGFSSDSDSYSRRGGVFAW